METHFVQGTPEWLAERRKGISGTDVAAILGVDQYKSRIHLWKQKTNGEETPETRLMEMGRAFEIVAVETYLRWSGDTGRPVNLIRHREYPFLLASPDYLLDSGWVLEIKCHLYPSPLTSRPIIGVENIPLRYYLQIQFYLEVTDKEHAILFSWTPNNGFTCYYMSRDRKLMERVLEDLFRFQDYLDAEVPPPRQSGKEKNANTLLVYDSMRVHTVQHTAM